MAKRSFIATTFLLILTVFVTFGVVTFLLQRKPAMTLRFVGISKGTLETPLEEMEFADRFEVMDRELIGVAAFEDIRDGTQVMATWFSPDERMIPLGRSTTFTQSGASVVRFSITAPGSWKPFPYLLRIDAIAQTNNESERPKTASGTVQFFIGMTDQQIQQYYDEYSEWEKNH